MKKSKTEKLLKFKKFLKAFLKGFYSIVKPRAFIIRKYDGRYDK